MGFVLCLYANFGLLREKSVFFVGFHMVPLSNYFFDQEKIAKKQIFWWGLFFGSMMCFLKCIKNCMFNVFLVFFLLGYTCFSVSNYFLA